MPLKHGIESALIVVLAFLVIAAGIVCGLLPTRITAATMTLWGSAFAVAILYPLFLYPLFRSRRADYELRVLHLAPAALLLGWLLLVALGDRFTPIQSLTRALTWGLSLPIVTIGFGVLVLFCIAVLRQWVGRLTLLSGLFTPFVALAVASEYAQWPAQVAVALERYEAGSALPLVGFLPTPDITQGTTTSADTTQKSDDRVRTTGDSKSSTPPRLPSAGPGDAVILFTLLPAAYCTILHARAKRRLGYSKIC